MLLLSILLLVPLASDPLAHRKLQRAEDVQGIPCAAGDSWFFANGKLANCFLAREFTIGAVSAPTGSWVSLRQDGHTDHVFLARNTPINSYTCKGGGFFGPSEGPATALYPSGALKTCWLAEDTLVDGVPCSHASMLADVTGGNSGTYFRENGKLEACMLSRDFEFRGKHYRKGERIRPPQ